jgi:hypothetical protein
MSQRSDVYLPPRSLSDLILHYRDVDFHVHKLVLWQHCDYFRAIVLSLQQQQPASSSSSSSSSLSSFTGGSSSSVDPPLRRVCSSDQLSLQPAAPVDSECCHSPPVACVQLPDSLGVYPADTGNLQLFLEHLYFPACIPSRPSSCVPVLTLA